MNGDRGWLDEGMQDNLRLSYRLRRRIHEEQSEYQKIEIVETEGYGRMLVIDSNPMVAERDEFVYHEMIAHVPLFVHPGVRRVLVIGGGDGGTVREVLRHPGVELCRLVEIDAKVVEACRRHLPSIAGALADPRVEVRIQDGVAYVATTRESYDLVLVDSTDPVGPAAPLFGRDFYRDVRRILTDDGIVVSQAESPFYDVELQAGLLEILHGAFDRVQLYNYSNLIYPGGLWSFSFAAKGSLCPVGDLDPQRVAASKLEFRYYSPAVHRAAFVHPEFQARRLQGFLTPLTSAEIGASSARADRTRR